MGIARLAIVHNYNAIHRTEEYLEWGAKILAAILIAAILKMAKAAMRLYLGLRPRLSYGTGGSLWWG
jgi:hypothetical protein